MDYKTKDMRECSFHTEPQDDSFHLKIETNSMDMIATTQSATPSFVGNEENESSASVLREANGSQRRSPTNNSPSPIVITQHASRPLPRIQSPEVVSTPPLGSGFEETDVQTTSTGETSGPDCDHNEVAFPTYLIRPPFIEVSRAAIEAIDPDLKYVSMGNIFAKLQTIGEQLLSVIQNSTIENPSRDCITPDYEVVVNDLAQDPPTHVLAVFGPDSHFYMHPAHALVLVAHCAKFPQDFPHSKPAPLAKVGGTLTLPVIRLPVRDPTTFPILLNYLYIKSEGYLLAELFPMLPPDEAQSIEDISQAFAATCTGHTLLSHVSKVHGLWTNMEDLGVFDENLWQGIEMAWEVLLDALMISTESSAGLQPQSQN